MGNGFTFPLLTLMCLAIVYAAQCRHNPNHGRLYVDFRSTGVFGDDIIVPKKYYDSTIDLLDDCGFVINRDKVIVRGVFANLAVGTITMVCISHQST